MTKMKTVYLGGLRTEAEHLQSGNKLITDAPLDNNGKEKSVSVSKDGVKKLNARRAIIAKLYDRQEQRKKGEKLVDFEARTQGIEMPLIEKIFNVLAPKYDARAKELGQKGGYTRIMKTGIRKGDKFLSLL